MINRRWKEKAIAYCECHDQAIVGDNFSVLFLTIGIENLSGGMGAAAFVAFLSSMCNRSHVVTQYALLSSFMAFSRTALNSFGGWLADELSWFLFFLLTPHTSHLTHLTPHTQYSACSERSSERCVRIRGGRRAHRSGVL